MPSTPLPPEKQAEIQDLENAIREAIDAEVNELAENLATTDDAHLFGDNEFKIRAIAHRITAKAIERRQQEKKRIRRFLGNLSALQGPAEFHSHRNRTTLSLVGVIPYQHLLSVPHVR